MSAAIFLDRDGTIIEDVGYITSPEQMLFLPRAIEALQRLQRQFRLFVVTNQPGIARGAITHRQLKNVHAHLRQKLADHCVVLEQIYYCPHDRSDACGCIKPEPYFLELAAADYGLDLAASYAIGDHPHDVEFARRAGARGIYLLTGHGRKHRKDLANDAVIAADLWEAADMILADSTGRVPLDELKDSRSQ